MNALTICLYDEEGRARWLCKGSVETVAPDLAAFCETPRPGWTLALLEIIDGAQGFTWRAPGLEEVTGVKNAPWVEVIPEEFKRAWSSDWAALLTPPAN